MGQPALKLQTKEAKDSINLVKNTHTEELVIAFCAQLGSDIQKIKNALVDELESRFKYTCIVIKLSKFISFHTKYKLDEANNEYQRIKQGMDGGNELREKYGKQILAELAIQEIIDDRIKRNPPEDVNKGKFNSYRVCYIIDSVKHPAEIQLLREVYRNLFYLIGVFSPIDLRAKNLSKLIKRNDGNIYELIDRDTGEDKIHGQNVEKAFKNSDYFIRVLTNEKSKLSNKVTRFLNLVFDIGVLTPSTDETAMYHATAAAANSSCLSRQVGACITDSKGEIISVGWNDVPKYGGNLYPDLKRNKDERCFNSGDCECANDIEKKQIKNSILEELKNEGILQDSNFDKKVIKILNDNGIKSLIEFSRAIHAEMHAIIIGSQKSGDKMIEGKLYCTTYPCHNCARHIIVAGISEVYFIEPYKKSLSTHLHSDAITENEHEQNKVKILMFEGVSPSRYIDFYQLVSDNRKTKNKAQDTTIAKPKNTMTLRALTELEAAVTNNLRQRNLH
jgi:deoxycytidylate deaminase